MTATMTDPVASTSVAPVRRVVFTVLAVLFGLGMGVAMGGLFVIVPALFAATGDGPHGEIHRIHDVSWGVWTAVIMGAAFLVQLRRPERKVAAMQQLMIGALASLGGLAMGGALALEYGAEGSMVVVSGTVIAAVALVAALHPARRQLFRGTGQLSPVLAPAALIASVPLIMWAVAEAALQRGGPTSDEHVLWTHYAGMTTVALAIPLLGLLAALKTPGWRIPAWCAGLSAALLGVASVMFPTHPSSLGVVWGAVALAGGIAFVGLAEWEARRSL